MSFYWRIVMKKLSSKIKLLLTLLILLFAITGCGKKDTITYNYLSAKESADVLGSIDFYYDGMGQKMLDFCCQKKGSTAEEYKEFSMNQTLDYTDSEKEIIDNSVDRIMKTIEENGYNLPQNTNISFAKTTMKEASGAAGYTHGTTVFLGQNFIDLIANNLEVEGVSEYCDEVVSHEIFHCLTRNNPDFRKDMYSFINFTINESDFDIPQEIKDELISNPDVRHHNSHAVFTINGEKKDCYLVFLTDNTFENPGDNFFDGMYTGLVDINDGTLYRYTDASDFYDVLGYNTEYCEDPEECMATNFSYAISYGINGYNNEGYKSPEIIENIIEYLKK